VPLTLKKTIALLGPITAAATAKRNAKAETTNRQIDIAIRGATRPVERP
jgi:hypothetical protein